ncbi:hypothetical protein FG05_35260 [Fusarium graminearum]|nr:hypothetical protein FG05_35260 [Fusarium graminearum]
MRSNLRR